jgi:hypothetical protein
LAGSAIIPLLAVLGVHSNPCAYSGRQRSSDTPISTTALSQRLVCRPLEASEIENTNLFNVVVPTILPTYNDQLSASGAINVDADTAFIRIAVGWVVLESRERGGF